MEIALALLLLFGGFTLGSISSEKKGDEPQSSMKPLNVIDATNLHSVMQAKSRSDLAECHSDGAVIYRDLTIPYSGQPGGYEGNRPNE